MSEDSIVIIGSGAVACVFAARLSAAGIFVKMLASWQEAVIAIRKNGVRLISPDGSEQAYPAEIVTDPYALGSVMHAIVLVKSWQTVRAAEQLTCCLAADGIVLTLQNGLGNEEILGEALGYERVAAGISVLGASLVAPGQVRTTGNEEVKVVEHQKLAFIIYALEKANIRVAQSREITPILWGKLVANLAINPLSAILQCKNGDLLTNPDAKYILEKLANEASEVAQALQIRLPYDDPVENVRRIIRKTPDNLSSMLQDRLRNAPTEIEAITGSLLKYAQIAGVDALVNQTIYQLMKAIIAVGKA